MNQNIIAQLIVLAAFAYVVYAIVRNVRAKDSSKCGGCKSCEFKHTISKMQKQNFKSGNFKYAH